jgi:hypothetical protein
MHALTANYAQLPVQWDWMYTRLILSKALTAYRAWNVWNLAHAMGLLMSNSAYRLLGNRRAKMRINPFIYGVVVLIVFFGIILGFQSAGIWSTSGKVNASGEAIAPSADDVNTIKGWMTLEQISITYNVSLADLIKQFNLPADTPATTAIKELESDTFDTTALRTWLESRSQLEVAPTTIKASQIPTEVSTSIPPAASEVTPATTQHVAPAMTITGKTTFQELLDWGVPKDVIQKIIGSDLPDTSSIIKDFVFGKGLEFTTVKTNLQVELDKLKP